MSPGSREKRAHRRVKADVPAHVVFPEAEDATTVQTLNLSAGGLYCRLRRYIPPMTRLRIAMVIPLRSGETIKSELLEFDGVVVRTEREREEPDCDWYHIAIYFDRLHEKGRSVIRRYVEQR